MDLTGEVALPENDEALLEAIRLLKEKQAG